MRKKLLALLMAAALALSLLAGCGGGESAASALLKLLDGRYPNISIEIDPELEAELRRAISAAEAENAGDDAAVIRAALETLLGSTITFRYLGDGQKGDTSFDLIFYAGSDPDKAAQAAYSQWNLVFSNVPDDGQYDTSLAMVETNSGVWMLVKATVEKAGTVDKPDSESEDVVVEGTSFTYNVTDGIITMKSEEDGSAENDLQNLFTQQADEAKEITDARNSGFDKITIELEAGKEYTVSNQLAADFKGTLKGESESSKATIKLSGGKSLFGTIADGAEVSYLDITVINSISVTTSVGNANVGAVAGENNGGTIQNCDVTISNSIQASTSLNDTNAGGIVGTNKSGGEISGCKVTISNSIEAHNGVTASAAGGIAGTNESGGEISGCTVTISNSIEAHNGVTNSAGGIVGYNSGEIDKQCTVTIDSDGKITASSSNDINAGGIVGYNSNSGTVSCGPATGTDGNSVYANAYQDSGGKYIASVTTSSIDVNTVNGTTGATAIWPTSPATPKAYAGTQCGKDGNRNSEPTSGPAPAP